MDLKIQDEKLLQGRHVLITAQGRILDYLILGNVIVILTTADNCDTDQNVFGYDLKGNLKWQIPEPDRLHERNFYTAIYLSSNNDLLAFSQNGVEVTIDYQNGSIIKKELVK